MSLQNSGREAVEAQQATESPRVDVSRVSGERSMAWTVTLVFGVLILIPSMLGFVMKFGELMALTKGVSDGGFAITPVINYLLASAGFFFLLLWAALNGMFRDLERPKYLMLENEQELDSHA
jgi:hypothetical protein